MTELTSKKGKKATLRDERREKAIKLKRRNTIIKAILATVVIVSLGTWLFLTNEPGTRDITPPANTIPSLTTVVGAQDLVESQPSVTFEVVSPDESPDSTETPSTPVEEGQ